MVVALAALVAVILEHYAQEGPALVGDLVLHKAGQHRIFLAQHLLLHLVRGLQIQFVNRFQRTVLERPVHLLLHIPAQALHLGIVHLELDGGAARIVRRVNVIVLRHVVAAVLVHILRDRVDAGLLLAVLILPVAVLAIVPVKFIVPVLYGGPVVSPLAAVLHILVHTVLRHVAQLI